MIAEDTPDQINVPEKLNEDSDNDSTPEINRITCKNPQKLYYSRATPPDIEESSQKIQNKYSLDAIYEWNTDGVVENNTINTLNQMVMVVNAYKTQQEVSDHEVANLLVAGFIGQLKRWWDNYLTDEQKSQILNAYWIYEYGQCIQDENGEIIQDAVDTLIFSISQHFIGDPSHVGDRHQYLLSNMKCKSLGR